MCLIKHAEGRNIIAMHEIMHVLGRYIIAMYEIMHA